MFVLCVYVEAVCFCMYTYGYIYIIYIYICISLSLSLSSLFSLVALTCCFDSQVAEAQRHADLALQHNAWAPQRRVSSVLMLTPLRPLRSRTDFQPKAGSAKPRSSRLVMSTDVCCFYRSWYDSTGYPRHCQFSRFNLPHVRTLCSC